MHVAILQRSLLMPSPSAENDTWISKISVVLGGKTRQKSESKLRPTKNTGVAVTIVRIIWEKLSSNDFRDTSYAVCGDLCLFWVSLWKFSNTSSSLVISTSFCITSLHFSLMSPLFESVHFLAPKNTRQEKCNRSLIVAISITDVIMTYRHMPTYFKHYPSSIGCQPLGY